VRTPQGDGGIPGSGIAGTAKDRLYKNRGLYKKQRTKKDMIKQLLVRDSICLLMSIQVVANSNVTNKKNIDKKNREHVMKVRVENGGYRKRMERRRDKSVRVLQETLIALQTIQILWAKS